MFAFLRKNRSYFSLIVFLAILGAALRAAIGLDPKLLSRHEIHAFVIGGVIFVSYFINQLAPRTSVPSFVWALFAGMLMQPALELFIRNTQSLQYLMEVFAAFILFAGGLEIPFRNFKRWFFPIASLSLIGVFASAILFSLLAYAVSLFLGLSGKDILFSVVILGAVLASTDPTAVIPTLANLKMRHPYLKQIAISESALTDISGSVLTRFLLLVLITAPNVMHGTVLSYFLPLIDTSSYEALALQIVTGVIVGGVGFAIIRHFYLKTKQTGTLDPALLFAVPLFTLTCGNLLGGAGFLSSFLAGLFSEVGGTLKKASHFYDNFLNSLVKPFIFIVLGALAPIDQLLFYAPIGLVVAILFIVVIRPLVVFLSLAPWTIHGKFSFRDLLFLSLVRETGIMAAVLLIISSSTEILNQTFLIAVGMWVILLTLIIEPPLTPALTRLIGLSQDHQKKRKHA